MPCGSRRPPREQGANPPGAPRKRRHRFASCDSLFIIDTILSVPPTTAIDPESARLAADPDGFSYRTDLHVGYRVRGVAMPSLGPFCRVGCRQGAPSLACAMRTFDLCLGVGRSMGSAGYCARCKEGLAVMVIRAVVFDIGGVLEITPDLGVTELWETRLGLPAGELNQRMHDAWAAGSIGAITEAGVIRAIIDRLGLDGPQLAVFMADIWREYLGTANTELIAYARRLRPRYRTGILSNSFVGAREREQAAYGFEDLVDEIVYSHEAGMSKPDPRIYALICARLGVHPHEMVFLDDADRCVAGAREAGLHAVCYHDNAQAIEEIEKLLTAP